MANEKQETKQTPQDQSAQGQTTPASVKVKVTLTTDHIYQGHTYLRGAHEVDAETAKVLHESEGRVAAARKAQQDALSGVKTQAQPTPAPQMLPPLPAETDETMGSV